MSWLFAIARNILLNQARRGVRRSHQRLDLVPEARFADEGSDGVILGVDWVRSVIAVLPARERDVIGFMDVVGLDAEATATALGISPITVRVTRHRALRRLRCALGAASAAPVVGALVMLTDLEP